MFHLAFPVRDLQRSREFYQSVLGCLPGRVNENWLDLYFFGNQLTLHELPHQVLPAERMGVRHFGMVLAWEEWQKTWERLKEKWEHFIVNAEIKYASQPREQGKIFLRDPDYYGIELKAYRHPKEALNLPSEIAE